METTYSLTNLNFYVAIHPFLIIIIIQKANNIFDDTFKTFYCVNRMMLLIKYINFVCFYYLYIYYMSIILYIVSIIHTFKYSELTNSYGKDNWPSFCFLNLKGEGPMM